MLYLKRNVYCSTLSLPFGLSLLGFFRGFRFLWWFWLFRFPGFSPFWHLIFLKVLSIRILQNRGVKTKEQILMYTFKINYISINKL